MKQEFLLWVLGLWGLLVVCAILNAGLRQSALVPAMGETLGYAMSSVTLSLMILFVTYAFLSRTDIGYTEADLWAMGAIWLILTTLFEFGFGHFVMGHSWDALLADYNFLEGKTWVLVLVTTFAAPFLMGTLLERTGH